MQKKPTGEVIEVTFSYSILWHQWMHAVNKQTTTKAKMSTAMKATATIPSTGNPKRKG